jgi:AcrR family transcriptional regulator
VPRGRTGSVLSEDVDEARAQLLDAAEIAFERFGVSKTTMDDIARQAGVTRSTVYRYFRDRDTLITAMIESRSRALFKKASKFLKSRKTFQDQLIEGLIYLVERGRADPIIRILVNPEHMDLATRLVGEGTHLATKLTKEMWEPYIERAKDSGQLRRDLDVDDACEWLALVQLMLVGRLDFSNPADPSHRKLLTSYLLPAFGPPVAAN